jgi:CheY-like chemotaxis protein
MEKAFCPACGMDVAVVHMTLGVGVSAEEVPRCSNCGFDMRLKDRAQSGVLFERAAIAEDMKSVRTAVKEDMVGHQIAKVVDEFEDGGTFMQAVQALSAQGRVYDLVILDLNMPVVNGLKAALFLRSMERKLSWQPIPILFFSSVVCDARLNEQIEKLTPAMYLNKGTIGTRADLPERLRNVLTALKRI